MKIRWFVTIALFVCIGFSMNAQSKKEIKQYAKAVKSGTVEGFNAFLAKFPQSVYAAKVEHFIDSIHFSLVNQEDLASCVGFITGYPDSEYNEFLKSKVRELALAQRYIQDNTLTQSRVLADFEDMEFSGSPYYYYVYENLPADFVGDLVPGVRCEYVVNMLDKKNGAIHSSMFSGKVIADKDGEGYLIEGDYMDEGSAGSYVVAEAIYLLGKLKEVDFLLPISEGDVMTDQAIEWWLKNNPSNTKRLKFGLLPEGSSIVGEFNKAKDTETKGGYKVAQFDIRGYTVITAYQSSSNQYILVWAEPVCKNTKKDPYLNTIYFENSTSLVLYYYYGRTTYKVRINMANKTIAR